MIEADSHLLKCMPENKITAEITIMLFVKKIILIIYLTF